MTEIQLNEFLNSKNYDIRLTHNARWIDQKCTPDVTWSIADFVLNYVDNVNETFTVKDIWTSEYARLTIAETYSKPGTDEETAENEYDKVFSQPLAMFCYAGILEDISETSRHLYKIANRDVLEYIKLNYSSIIIKENICFLCSEEKPYKCHRRLVSEKFKQVFDVDIKHI